MTTRHVADQTSEDEPVSGRLRRLFLVGDRLDPVDVVVGEVDAELFALAVAGNLTAGPRALGLDCL